MPLTHAELYPLYKEIYEKNILELDWKPKRKRPNLNIDNTISQVSEAINDTSLASTQNIVAKQFEFDDEASADDANGESSFAAKRMLTSNAMKPRAKPVPTSMNKILNDLKKQQQSVNVTDNSASMNHSLVSAEDTHAITAATGGAAQNESTGTNGTCDDVLTAIPVTDLPSRSQLDLSSNLITCVNPMAVITENVDSQPNTQSQFDVPNATMQSQHLEMLDLTISSSQDCF